MFPHTRTPHLSSRVGRFALVGLGGLVIQMIVLDLLTRVAALDYRAATVLAVEAAVLHNFVWHERWSWRVPQEAGGRMTRAARFHATTALLSIVGSVILMSLFVDVLGWPVLPANLAAVAILGIANFRAADGWVFREHGCETSAGPTTLEGRPITSRQCRAPLAVAAGLLLTTAGPVFAGPPADTVMAWTRYVAMTERRIDAELGDGRRFLAMDFEPGRSHEDRRKLQNGHVLIEQVASDHMEAGSIDVPGGTIHTGADTCSSPEPGSTP